jgi:hypothetical protein
VKVDEQLVKLNSRSAEFFLLHHFLVSQTRVILNKKDFEDRGMDMDDITAACEQYPDAVLPPFRKKRTYLNAVLSKNERDREDANSKKLFLRIARGVYVLNPALEVNIAEDEWMNVYEMMFAEKMTPERNQEIKQEAIKAFHEQAMANLQKVRAQEQAARRKRLEEAYENRWRW